MRKSKTFEKILAGLGTQDAMFWDPKKFINVYPYNYYWYQLAYGDPKTIRFSVSYS